MAEQDPQVIEGVTCLGCGCLCDDIALTVESGRIVQARNACEAIGQVWFQSAWTGEGWPQATIEGVAVDLDQAIERASEILQDARSPLVYGLKASSIEAQREALAIADRIGAVVDPAASTFSINHLRAFQRVGQISSTLGEVKDRADLIVFWGVDPATSHPRHRERYSVMPSGRFLEGPRTVLVIGDDTTLTARSAEDCLPVAPARFGETLWSLRALVRGRSLDRDRTEQSTGVPYNRLEDLAGRLMSCRYGAFFFGPSLDSAWAVEGALTLVRDLNEGRRFVASTLGSGDNSSGLEAILNWQAGGSQAIDYGPGYPRSLPGDATLKSRGRRGEVDALLIVGDDPLEVFPHVTTIRISPGATHPDRASTVAFNVGRAGIESGGTVSRVDGVMLPLRPAFSGVCLDATAILAAIRRSLVGAQ